VRFCETAATSASSIFHFTHIRGSGSSRAYTHERALDALVALVAIGIKSCDQRRDLASRRSGFARRRTDSNGVEHELHRADLGGGAGASRFASRRIRDHPDNQLERRVHRLLDHPDGRAGGPVHRVLDVPIRDRGGGRP
jgi:hypothetical protein